MALICDNSLYIKWTLLCFYLYVIICTDFFRPVIHFCIDKRGCDETSTFPHLYIQTWLESFTKLKTFLSSPLCQWFNNHSTLCYMFQCISHVYKYFNFSCKNINLHLKLFLNESWLPVWGAPLEPILYQHHECLHSPRIEIWWTLCL